MSTLLFRQYNSKDLEACLAIFDSNTPPYFDDEERDIFASWLKQIGFGNLAYSNTDFNYYEVAELDGQVVACAGYYVVNKESAARMAWGMVHRSHHSKGFGSAHLKRRIELIQEQGAGYQIDLGTSQHTFKFYEKHGFEVASITANGYGQGIDKYDMVLRLK